MDIIWDTIKDMTEEQLTKPKEPPKKPEPEPDKAKVEAIVADLRFTEKNGGLIGIARKNGVSPQTVKLIYAAMKKRLSELLESVIV